MKLSRGQIVAVLSIVFTSVIAFLIGIVNSSLPLPWIQSHLWLVLALLGLFFTLLLFITIKGSESNNPVSEIKEEQFNDFVRTVTEAENKAQVDPGFEHIPYIGGKLAEWENTDARLIGILNIEYTSNDDAVGDWQPRKDNEQLKELARLVLRLTKAIMPYLTRHSRPVKEQLEYLSKFVVPAYVIATGLEEWAYAIDTAYTLALSFYGIEKSTRAKYWMAQMEKCLKHINVYDISDDLHFHFFEIKGLITRDFDGDLKTARKYLNDALVYANRAKKPLLSRRITVHLATLEKKDRNFVKANELYKQALDIASPLNDPELTLECYQALGDLAFYEEKDVDSAYHWYTQLLQLAKSTLLLPSQVSAHKGLADCLLFKSTPHDTKQAYYHAREALRIEDKESNKSELYILIISIADKLWSQN